MMEEWRDICGYEGKYQVSSMGRVKSLNYLRTGKCKILKPGKFKNGYLYVILCKNSKVKSLTVHRLVATAFIENPYNKPQVDHINTIRTDNRADNLNWVTSEENSNNVLTISKRYGSNNHNARKVLQLTREGVLIREWKCIMDASRELGFAIQNISKCCRGKLKTAYNYIWKYA